MKNLERNKRPSLFSERLLGWCCKPEYLEEILGDLAEYRDELLSKPKWKRKLFYWFHVLQFIRPWALKRLQSNQQLNQLSMFSNYLKTSVRSLKKNALFSFINMIGLAISMSVAILMILVITELNSFDDFHENSERIYRVTSNKFMFNQELDMATASFFLGNEVKKQSPGVEEVVILKSGMSADIKTNAGLLNVSGFYATESFFDVFSFKLLQGNPETVFLEPNNIVLTETTAVKLFGGANPIGKELDIQSTGGWQTRSILGKVVGVVEDPPLNSHLEFEALVSMKTYDQPATGSGWRADFRTNPNHFQNSFVYLLLNQGADLESIETSMSDIISAYNSDQEHKLSHKLQHMSTFVSSDKYQNRVGPRFSQRQLYIMIGLTLIVLLSACFNYTNLSLARALRRSKEVGVRKVTGASQFQLFAQFIIEAILLSVLAFIIGLGLFYLIKPGFLNMPNPGSSGHDMFTLGINFTKLLYLIICTIGVGLVAGFLPAWFLSKLNANTVLKDASRVKLFGGLSLRRALTVFQFVLSIGLIMSAVLVNKQYKYALGYDLGFETENIINVKVKGDYGDQLEAEFNRVSEVAETSRSSMAMGTGGAELAWALTEDKSQKAMLFWNGIDEKYLNMHDFEIIAGTGFLRALKKGESNKQIIVNEHLLQTLNLGSPEEAIGKFIWVQGYVRDRLQITGVVKNFINTSLNAGQGDEIMANKNFAFVQGMPVFTHGLIAVKFKTNDLPGFVQKLESIYNGVDNSHPFEADFYKDQIAKTYESEKNIFTLVSFLAFLAISISMLGLLGMAVFTTESRLKEISIRKVLGADSRDLTLLLSRGFLMLIGLSALIAIPLSNYVVNEKVLSSFNYRAPTGIIDWLSGFLVVLFIGTLTIAWQIRQATTRAPSTLLRNE